MEWITETGLKILDALETYQFLTAAQLTRAGGFKSVVVVRQAANGLAERRPPAVHCKDFGAVAGIGRLSKVYALSERGAEILAEYRRCDPSEVRHLTGKIQFSLDYAHRLAFVDFHILFREWAAANGAEIGFFSSYFETDGANRSGPDALKLTRRNRVEIDGGRYVVPDGIAGFSHKGKHRLFAVEIHRGNDSKLIAEQLGRHVAALYSGAFQARFGHPSAHFVLSVYENRGALESVRQRVQAAKGFGQVARAVHFATLDDLRTDFAASWTLADGSEISLFG